VYWIATLMAKQVEKHCSMLLTIFDNMLPSAGSFPAGEEETQSKSAGVLHRNALTASY